MGKNIKSYATTQIHSPGKGREALRQKVQIFHLKYGTAYATTQVHFHREREGSLTANNPNLSATNVIWLNRTHSF